MNSIFKKIAFICILFYLMLISFSCKGFPASVSPIANLNSNQSEVNNNMSVAYKPEIGDVIVYNLSKETFQEFLLQPSMDIISQKNDSFSVYRKSTNGVGYIQEESFGAEGKKDEAMSGYFRIGSWPVYTEFVDFMNDVKNFEQILLEHNIKAQILNSVIIKFMNYDMQPNGLLPPGTTVDMCIWLHTDNGDYFLQHNAYLYEDPNDTNFLYDFLTLEEYYSKYSNN